MMNLFPLFLTNAIISLVFGLASIFIPQQLASLYGESLDPVGIALYRVIGAYLLGHAAIAWFVRNAPPSEARQAVVIGNFYGFLASTLVFTVIAFQFGSRATLWLNVLISLAFALAYGYFAFLKPERGGA
jgi:apolipoprotein N-acyltransferase